MAAPGAEAALEHLCKTYWYPVYGYVRRRGHSPEDSKDLTQEFFARLLEKRAFAAADPAKGKFRSFLIVALNHFLANEWDRSRRLKRGGGEPLVSLDDTAEERYLLEASTNITPETFYERRWALTLLERALEKLRKELDQSGRKRQFQLLQPFLSAESQPGDYDPIARELGMTHGAVTVAVHRLRVRYRDLVRDEIAHTVAEPADVDEELRSLFAALG